MAGAFLAIDNKFFPRDDDLEGCIFIHSFDMYNYNIPISFFLKNNISQNEANTNVESNNSKLTNLSPSTLQTLLILAGVGCCLAMAMPQVHIVALCVERVWFKHRS